MADLSVPPPHIDTDEGNAARAGRRAGCIDGVHSQG
jgi:hypothetical protein